MNLLWENIFKSNKTEDLIRRTLSENVLFCDLSRRELALIHKLVHRRTFRSGEVVFKQGEIGVGMYIIARGRVEIFVRDQAAQDNEASDIFITQLTEGDFFGEIALTEDNGRRTATAIAKDETILLGFFKPDLLEVLSRNQSAGTKILMRLAEILGRRLKETTDKISELRRALKELGTPPPFEVKR